MNNFWWQCWLNYHICCSLQPCRRENNNSQKFAWSQMLNSSKKLGRRSCQQQNILTLMKCVLLKVAIGQTLTLCRKVFLPPARITLKTRAFRPLEDREGKRVMCFRLCTAWLMHFSFPQPYFCRKENSCLINITQLKELKNVILCISVFQYLDIPFSSCSGTKSMKCFRYSICESV